MALGNLRPDSRARVKPPAALGWGSASLDTDSRGLFADREGSDRPRLIVVVEAIVPVMPLPDPQTPLASTEGLSWYTVPETVKQWLALASEHWDEPEVGDRYMDRALEQAGDHPDVLISAYRYFFYTQNYARALHVTETVLAIVRANQVLPEAWSELKPLLNQRRDEPEIRLYINAYAASSLIQARLGAVELAKQIATQVSELENQNEFGGKVVRDILEQPDDDEEE